jgi:hypothetical protein
MRERARITLDFQHEHAFEVVKAKRRSGDYTENEAVSAGLRIDRALTACLDPDRTNAEVGAHLGVTRRQASRLRHGSEAAWARLA